MSHRERKNGLFLIVRERGRKHLSRQRDIWSRIEFAPTSGIERQLTVADIGAIGADKTKNLVLESVHPSPLSANRGGWFGNHQFSRCNAYLEQNGMDPIKW